MCFVNSQNVRDLRQPFGGTKASGTGREGGTWSYEVFCEPKNVCVSITRSPHPALGRVTPMSLYAAQKLLYHLNREPAVQARFKVARRLRCSTTTSSPPRSARPSSPATSASSTSSAPTASC